MVTIRILFCLLAVATACFALGGIDLAGTWRFEIDRKDEGIGQKWFDRKLSGKINLPGAMQNQGFGDDLTVKTQFTGEMALERWRQDPQYAPYRVKGNIKLPFMLTPPKHYVGAAWYQRDVDIPSGWENRRVVLSLERAHWQTRAWIDQRDLGAQDSLATAHVYDLGTGLKPGRHTLTLRVDNRVQVGVGDWAHSITDQTQGNWNGIVGDLRLDSTPPVWIEDVQVYPDVTTGTARIRVTIGNATDKSGSGSLIVNRESFPAAWGESGGGLEFTIQVAADKPWDEFTPYLQTVSLSLGEDRRTVSFGMREVQTKDRKILVNGRPTFLRGTLECCIFPKTGYPPTDVESWKRILKIAKSYGLNHLRFHSWCPPEAAFLAADEMGFYYQIECCAWAEIGKGQPIDKWLYDEAGRILKAYGNHPSFAMLAYGNEPAGEIDTYLSKWVEHWKATEARQIHTTGSGWPTLPGSDFHVTPNAVRGPSGWVGRDYSGGVAELPAGAVVVHEMGQWCAYPNFEEIAKYDGYMKARNFEIFRDSLAQHGMLDQAHDFLMASGALQVECYKEEIEAALRTPGIAGVQLLDLHDFPGQGTALVGVLDAFWESKGYIKPEAYRRFYNTTVPLARLDKRIWSSDETLAASVEVAHYGPAPLAGAVVKWKILDSTGAVRKEGTFDKGDIPLGSGNTVGEVRFALGELPAPAVYRLVVGIDGTEFENDWSFWVYSPLPSVDLGDVLLATDWDDRVRSKLADGGAVMLMPKLRMSNPRLTFEPVFWNAVMFSGMATKTLGLLVQNRHPALDGFPTDTHSDWQWREIVSSARGLVIDKLPRDLRPIVQPIDDWNSNRRLGLVFECQVGRGKLMICTSDLTSFSSTNPAAIQLYRSLVRYMNSNAFQPKVAVDVKVLDELFEPADTNVSRLGGIVTTDSFEQSYEAENAIDGDPNTIWDTEFNATTPKHPHWLQIDLRKPTQITGLYYLPRQDMANGRIADYEIEVSDDGVNWRSIQKGRWVDGIEPKTLRFSETVRYIRLVAKSEVNGNAWTSIAEIDVLLRK